MSDLRIESVGKQISCVGEVDAEKFELMRHEVLSVPRDWVVEYGKYQSGGWRTLSLLNDSGNAKDVKITDCDPVETDLMLRMPATRDYLNSLGLRFMWARLACLEPNSFLWEHRDYGELNTSERHRLHIPLVTNSSAAIVTGGYSVCLSAGRLWRLTPTHVHGACNLLGPARVHLILDCYYDDALEETLNNESLDSRDVRALPAVDRSVLAVHMEEARNLLRLGYASTAERSLLRLFYRYALPEGALYDCIADVYESEGRPDKATEWRKTKSVMLGYAGN